HPGEISRGAAGIRNRSRGIAGRPRRRQETPSQKRNPEKSTFATDYALYRVKGLDTRIAFWYSLASGHEKLCLLPASVWLLCDWLVSHCADGLAFERYRSKGHRQERRSVPGLLQIRL